MEGDELIPFSPTISSLSSSDLDTESTGSFFHDRSTTLGTLMGVDIAIPVRVSPQIENDGVNRRKKAKKGQKQQQQQGKCWWRLCRDNAAYRSVNKPSLGDFLAVERRSGGGESALMNLFYSGEDEFESVGRVENGRLFADGRVLPPRLAAEAAAAMAPPPSQTIGSGISRLPVLLTGICSGGG